MGANIKWDTLGVFERHKANLLVECRACPNFGILDAAKLNRYFHCQHWNTSLEVVGLHLRCRICRGRPGYIRPTPKPPDRPQWMEFEYQWRALVTRLRNR